MRSRVRIIRRESLLALRADGGERGVDGNLATKTPSRRPSGIRQVLKYALLSFSFIAPARADMTSVCRALHHAYLRLPRNGPISEWPALAIAEAHLKTPQWKEIDPSRNLPTLKLSQMEPWGRVEQEASAAQQSRMWDKIRPSFGSGMSRNLSRPFRAIKVPLRLTPRATALVTVYRVSVRSIGLDSTLGRPFLNVPRAHTSSNYVMADIPGWKDDIVGTDEFATSVFITDVLYSLDTHGNVYELDAFEDEGARVVVSNRVCNVGNPFDRILP